MTKKKNDTVENFNLEEAILRMKKYSKNNPMKFVSEDKLENYSKNESGILAGKTIYNKIDD